MALTTQRLLPGDEALARELLAVLAQAFDEPVEPLDDAYVARLLATSSFWVVAAFEGERVVGGLTAHTLPMTRTPTSELFVYDLAVREDFRRQGVARQLMGTIRSLAADAGIADVFVPADADDTEAVAFYRSLGWEESAVRFFVS